MHGHRTMTLFPWQLPKQHTQSWIVAKHSSSTALLITIFSVPWSRNRLHQFWFLRSSHFLEQIFPQDYWCSWYLIKNFSMSSIFLLKILKHISNRSFNCILCGMNISENHDIGSSLDIFVDQQSIAYKNCRNDITISRVALRQLDDFFVYVSYEKITEWSDFFFIWFALLQTPKCRNERIPFCVDFGEVRFIFVTMHNAGCLRRS